VNGRALGLPLPKGAAATVFAQPTGSDIGGGVPQNIALATFLGASTSTVFAGLRSLFRPGIG
jgi:hypothetical protein